MCNPPPPSTQGVNGAHNVAKLYASGGTDISKCIEGRSIKLTKLVDNYMYWPSNAFPFKEFNFFLFFF